MNVFDLHKGVVSDYRDFVLSFIKIADDRTRERVEIALKDDRVLWPDPLLQVSPSYVRSETVDVLAHNNALDRLVAHMFRTEAGKPFHLYRHQQEALDLANAGKSYVVTSGTGSGKSLTYFLPIINSLVNNPSASGSLSALIVYPMNALVNSQLQALRNLKKRFEDRTGQQFPVTFERYTGVTPRDVRFKIRRKCPQIILTNYMMAELMLVRAEDYAVLDSARRNLRFLVFDELHTYRGRQGADVAMLIRRLKERAAGRGLVQVGTSATMVASPRASPADRKQAVAEFAQRLFGCPFEPTQVVEETIEPFTLVTDQSARALQEAVDERIPGSLKGLRSNPLASWVESRFGVEPEAAGWKRKQPSTLQEAARDLATVTKRPFEACRSRLKEVLSLGSLLRHEDGTPAFAFKLHQFVGQGRHVHATLEAVSERQLSFDGQIWAAEGKILAPLRFCRHCGQDYYHLIRGGERFEPHPGVDVPLNDQLQPGWLMVVSEDADWSSDRIPEAWLDKNGRPTRTWRPRIPKATWVGSDGQHGPERAGSVKGWWQADSLFLCLRCNESYTKRQRDFVKLGSLSNEGRSSATTVLAMSLLRHSAEMSGGMGKLLTFTDNRQDASLQAGHFNDFVHVGLLRSAMYAALRSTKELAFDTVVDETINSCGLTLRDIAREPTLLPRTYRARRVWKAFSDITEYRVYNDLRGGWRIVQPNLEQVGLLRIDYAGLEELAEDTSAWSFHKAAAKVSASERAEVVRAVLDRFRRKFAISRKCLEETAQQQIRRRAEQQLNAFWGLDPEVDELIPASWFVTSVAPGRRGVFPLTLRSAIGKFLIRQFELSPDEYPGFLDGFLELLVAYGLLSRSEYRAMPRNRQGVPAFQLDAACLVWRLGNGGVPSPSPIDTHHQGSSASTERAPNKYFRAFYSQPGDRLATLEAREHTAQVVEPGAREIRERRFRWERADSEKERQLGRRLPYLVCSPTMELGIDIADLDLVHMRNVPPTPANYAQRSGRAGRQGQPGLIFTYCGATSSHDQYFFRTREQMVAGIVRPPRVDISNEALLRAHAHAVWLAYIRLSLGDRIDAVIDCDSERLPLRQRVASQIALRSAARQDMARRIRTVLAGDAAALESDGLDLDDWIDRVLQEVPRAFDRAFDRWRELYRVAQEQLRSAARSLESVRSRRLRGEAERLQREALRQRDILLRENAGRDEGDFYPYRYLASEGFLPGYNFPALPILLWVPRRQGEYIQRPRFVALREFGPQNIVYHEGSKWEATRFQFPAGGFENRCAQRRLCTNCGGYCEISLDLCPICRSRFDGENSVIASLLDMPNVTARRRERITCDEEERRRRGYDIKTFYRYSSEPTGFRRRQADVTLGGKALLRLTYAPAASVLQVNHGWRGSKHHGFRIDSETGEMLQDGRQQNSATSAHQGAKRVEVEVRSTRNVLLVRLAETVVPLDRSLWSTLRYALLRGCEQEFEVEESELRTESVGAGQHQAILIYEAAEGGAGVLRRLVDEPDAVARVARVALERCHFDQNGANENEDCHKACYECLMSFGNQRDARHLDRHKVLPLLLELTGSMARQRTEGRDWESHYQHLRSMTDSRSEIERRFLDLLASRGHRLPDAAQQVIDQVGCIPDFWYRPNVCVFCDGSVHDEPETAERDREIREELVALGYRVIVVRYDEPLQEQVGRHPDVFGWSREQ